MRDGDVFEGDVELRGTLHEVRPDPVGDGFTLGDEFGGVELGDDGFEDFVADGGEDTFVVIGTVGLPRQPLSSFYIGFGKGGYLVDRRQLGNIRPVQNSQRQANHLQILTPCRRRDIARLRADIVDNSSLQPRNEKVRALVDHCLLHSRQSVEDDCPGSAADIVQRGVDESCARSDGDG